MSLVSDLYSYIPIVCFPPSFVFLPAGVLYFCHGHTITFRPPVTLVNLLPTDMEYFIGCTNHHGVVKAGKEKQLCDVSSVVNLTSNLSTACVCSLASRLRCAIRNSSISNSVVENFVHACVLVPNCLFFLFFFEYILPCLWPSCCSYACVTHSSRLYCALVTCMHSCTRKRAWHVHTRFGDIWTVLSDL